jgi:hypothetical protein
MRIEVENRAKTNATLYFQIDYALGAVPADAATFHAQFRQVRPLPDKTDYVILDGVRGRGQYVGTYMTYGIAHSGWWGEGEIKFFLDSDREFPTIAGTGTEDYFNGSYDFVSPVPIPALCRCCGRKTGKPTPASAFIAGTSPIQCASNPI